MSDFADDRAYSCVLAYNGERKKWHTWANQAMGTMTMCNLKRVTIGSEPRPTFEVDIEAWDKKNSIVYNRLVMALEGPAATLVPHDGSEDGAGFWQKLVDQYDGVKPSHRPQLRKRLFDLSMLKNESAEDLCARLDSYAADAIRAGATIDDDEKRSILIGAVPSEFSSVGILLQAQEDDKYPATRRKVIDLLSRVLEEKRSRTSSREKAHVCSSSGSTSSASDSSDDEEVVMYAWARTRTLTREEAHTCPCYRQASSREEVQNLQAGGTRRL